VEEVGESLFTSEMGDSRVIECPIQSMAEQTKLSMFKYLNVLTIIESDLNCSGMCTPTDLYLFTDVNRGIPAATCRTALAD
jgi:hypothetical protein